MWRPPAPPYPGYPPGYYHQGPPPPANNMDLASAAEQWARMQAANQQVQTEQSQYAYPPQPQFQQQHQYAAPPSYPQPVQQQPWPPQAPQGSLPPPAMPQYHHHPPPQDPYADPLERRTTGLLGHAPPPQQPEFEQQGSGAPLGPPQGYNAPPASHGYQAPQAYQAPPGQFQAQFAQPGLPAGVHPHFQQPYEPSTALPLRPPLPVDPALVGGGSAYQPYVAPDGSSYHDATGGYPYQYDYSSMPYHPGFDFESLAQSHNAEAIKKLPPWLREGLEKLEREKQKEREKQRFMQEYEAKIKEESGTTGEKSGKTSKFDSSPSRSRSNSPVVMKVESEEEESEEEEEAWSDEIRRLTLIQATKDIVTSVLMNATTRVLEKTCTTEIEARKGELNKSSGVSGKTGGLAAFLSFTGSDSEEDGEDGQPPPVPKGAIKGASTAQKSMEVVPSFGGVKLSVESSPSPSPEREKKELKPSEHPLNSKRNEADRNSAKGRAENGSSSSKRERESKRSRATSSSSSSPDRSRDKKRYQSPEPKIKIDKKRVSRWNKSPEDDKRKKDEDKKESSRREEKRPQRERSRDRTRDVKEERPSLKRSESTRSGKSTTSSSSKTSRREERRRSDSRSDEDDSRRKRSQRYS